MQTDASRQGVDQAVRVLKHLSRLEEPAGKPFVARFAILRRQKNGLVVSPPAPVDDARNHVEIG